DGSVSTIVVQLDGKVVIAGSFTTVGGQSRKSIARLYFDGTLDGTFVDADLTYPDSFGPHIDTMAAQPDNKIIIGGYFATVQGVARPWLARLQPDGGLDTTFDAQADQPI